MFFKFFYGFIVSTAEEMTGNRTRERGSDMWQEAPDRDSNPGPLRQGISLSSWEALSTNESESQKMMKRIKMYIFLRKVQCVGLNFI